MIFTNNEQGYYILDALQRINQGGDSYALSNDLYNVSKEANPSIDEKDFLTDLSELIYKRQVVKTGKDDYYLLRTWQMEMQAAAKIAEILEDNDRKLRYESVECEDSYHVLCEEQEEAVKLALEHRFSLITGGPGSGKTTLIRNLIMLSQGYDKYLVCAPTGKAARNLTRKTGFKSTTIHSALGCADWDSKRIVIVDEVGMMTLELLLSLLKSLNDACQIVFLGDEDQLQAVGCGNVILDLIKTGIPHIRLQKNHRQDEDAQELIYNIKNFNVINDYSQLRFGESFQLRTGTEIEAFHGVVRYAAEKYRSGANVQVITPRKDKVLLSAEYLNQEIRKKVNPRLKDEHCVVIRKKKYYNGERVMITKNDWEKGVCNGDVGTIFVSKEEWYIQLLNGMRVKWDAGEEPYLELAYAITVHKAQGSEYEEVIMPMTSSLSSMLDRNMLFTAFSRPQKKLVIFGEEKALKDALHKKCKIRKSNLPQRVSEIRKELC